MVHYDIAVSIQAVHLLCQWQIYSPEKGSTLMCGALADMHIS